MKARITTSGGEMIDGIPTVQHWSLHVDGEFISDTMQPQTARFFQRIADAINRGWLDTSPHETMPTEES